MVCESQQSPKRSTQFAECVLSSPNATGFCVSTLLAWLTAIDEKISEGELSYLAFATKNAVGNEAQLQLAIGHAIQGDLRDLQLACEIVKTLDVKNSMLFVELAIGVALADDNLGNAESHVLLFFADLVGVTLEQLHSLFRDATGHDFPLPGDPSSLEWWEKRDKRFRTDGMPSSNEQKGEPSPGANEWRNVGAALGPAWAYAILGVESAASNAEIRSAFFRLSRVHHPDRFHSLGDDAVHLATATYKRIVGAYEALGQP